MYINLFYQKCPQYYESLFHVIYPQEKRNQNQLDQNEENKNVFRKTDTSRNLMATINRRKTLLFRCILRHNDFITNIIRIIGKKRRGQSQMKILGKTIKTHGYQGYHEMMK